MKDRSQTPQEKKMLSLKKDRRDFYGENSKSSRENVPKRKALANRKIRHATKQKLETQGQDESDAQLLLETKKKWRKCPDIPLGEYLVRRTVHRTS